MASVYLFLAEGFEEVEAITPIDFLRRAEIDLRTVSVTGSRRVCGSHGVEIHADCLISDLSDLKNLKPRKDSAGNKASFVHDDSIGNKASSIQALICPGGMPGSANLAAHSQLCELLRLYNNENTYICAICAAPALVLGASGANILGMRRFTCYPGFEKQAGAGQHCTERVVRDGRLITAIGAGAAAEFSMAIIEALKGHKAAEAVHSSTMQVGTYR